MTAIQVITLVLGSSGLFSFILALLQRRWSKKDSMKSEMDELSAKIDTLADTLKSHIKEDQENDIRMARRDILRFNDEIRRGQAHTAESFDDILEAIDAYEHYCASHPDFENNKCVLAIDNIKRVYKERLEKNDFL